MTRPAPVRARNRQFEVTDLLPFIKAPQMEHSVELRSLDRKVSVTGIYAERSLLKRVCSVKGGYWEVL